jgi:hypothetical protein
MEKFQFGLRIDQHHAIRLGDLRSDLGQMFCPRHADRDRQAELSADTTPDRRGDLRW